MKGNRKITRSEKKLFFIVGFALIFIIAFGAWRQWVDAIPKVEIPTPKMPSPNAYDFYVKAGASIIPANPAVDPVHDPKVVPKVQWKTHYPTARKEACRKRNATALNLLRQGFQHRCHAPLQRSFNFKVPSSYSSLRSLARLLAVESHARSERDDWNGAADSALDTLKLGHDISQGGGLIDFLVGASINAIGRRELWEILPHLNATESKLITQRLEKILESRVQYADVLREEKHSGQAGFVEAKKSGEWRSIGSEDATVLTLLKEYWQTFKTRRRVVFNTYTDYMDSLIARAQKPYTAKILLPAVPDDMLVQIIAPVYGRARWNYARDESGNAFILIALALRAYRLNHNRYPQSLNQLVPRYLKRIPADPFGAGEALRYKLAGREYSLYSIGPDGIDNRGRAIEDAKYPRGKRRRFLMQLESKGDFVAGVNH